MPKKIFGMENYFVTRRNKSKMSFEKVRLQHCKIHIHNYVLVEILDFRVKWMKNFNLKAYTNILAVPSPMFLSLCLILFMAKLNEFFQLKVHLIPRTCSLIKNQNQLKINRCISIFSISIYYVLYRYWIK